MDPVVTFIVSDFDHHKRAARSFKKGLEAHGVEMRVEHILKAKPPYSLVVSFGHRFHSVHKAQKEAGLHYLTLESGAWGYHEGWVSLGYDGLQNRARYCNENSPPDRWLKSGQFMQPWREDETGYRLILGQVKGDEATRDVDLEEFYDLCRESAPGEVRFRPHPKVSPRGPLHQDLECASSCVTWSSGAAVHAVLAGVPTIVADRGCMAWDVRGLDHPDREQWAYDLAYTQWRWDEIESGEAWDHVKDY